MSRWLMALAAALFGLSLALTVAGSYWATDARRDTAMARAVRERAEQTSLIRANRRNLLRICAALATECEP